VILWRPVGLREMALVFELGMRAFPERLPEQPIFYPVLVEEYADQIARTWNTKEEPFAGYVLEMDIPDDYASRFAPQTVGGSMHRELWVPAEIRTEFNDHLTRAITVRRAFFGEKYRGHVPEKFGLRGADASKQIAVIIGTMDYSMFDFVMEVSANMLTFFLNFPFWKAAGADRLGVDANEFDRCLEYIRKAWARSPRPAALLEEGAWVDS
jgi:hypothetical protein